LLSGSQQIIRYGLQVSDEIWHLGRWFQGLATHGRKAKPVKNQPWNFMPARSAFIQGGFNLAIFLNTGQSPAWAPGR